MLAMLGLGALSFGGSLLQGIGAKQASAKQGRMQMIADAMAREENNRILAEVNAKREQLGTEMLMTPEQRGVDAEAFMATADRLGLNPVTYLNAGGLSSHGWVIGHNAEAAYKLMAPEYQLSQASQVPQQHSMLSALGAGLSAAGTAMGTQYRADQSYGLQMAKMDMSMDQFMMGLSGRNGLATALTNSGGVAGVANASSGASSQGGVSALPYWGKWEQGKVEVTNPSYQGWVDPTQSNAQNREDRGGEIAGEVYGISNEFHDMVRSVTGRTIRDWGIASGLSLAEYHKGSNSIGETLSRWYSDPTSVWNRSRVNANRAVTPYTPFAGSYPAWATP